MSGEMLGIGQVARASGLTVSALRFYDGAAVLAPARVDLRSGYRWYEPEQVDDARLVARLRRVGMPVSDIRRVLEARSRPEIASALIRAHLKRLEDGLADARRELSLAEHAILTKRRHDMGADASSTRFSVPARQLRDALRATRFAAATDAEFPMLGGVLLEVEPGGVELRLVATDRYRLALATVPMNSAGRLAARVIVPSAFVTDVVDALAGRTDDAVIDIEGEQISVTTEASTLLGRLMDYDFPDYQQILRAGRDRRVATTAADLRTLLAGDTFLTRNGGDDRRTCVLAFAESEEGRLEIVASAADLRIGVDREFLLEAIDAVGEGELTLELDGPITPLAIRNTGSPDRFSILMPVDLSRDSEVASAAPPR